MKTYVITLSKRFPARHRRAGELTFFHEALLNAINIPKVEYGEVCPARDKPYQDKHIAIAKLANDETINGKKFPQFSNIAVYKQKLHTIRANYSFWAKRIAEVERGEACLSVRQWTDKPYHSKQVEIARLTKKDGVGIQKLEFIYGEVIFPFIEQTAHNDGYVDLTKIADNDGLAENDFCNWFDSYDLTQPMAIIHFTKFRY